MDQQQVQAAMTKDAKAGDAITFELASTGKWHCHTILEINEEGDFLVRCGEKDLMVTPAEVRRLWPRVIASLRS